MANRALFNRALLFGLAIMSMVGFAMFRSPDDIFALTSASDNVGMRLYTSKMSISGMTINDEPLAGRNLARLDVKNLQVGGALIIERDLAVSRIVPGAHDVTVRVSGMGLQASGGSIYSADACVRGTSLSSMPLLNPLLDPIVNSILKNGYNGGFVAELVNLIGQSKMSNVSIQEFRSDAPLIRFQQVRLKPLQIGVLPAQQSPEFYNSCL